MPLIVNKQTDGKGDKEEQNKKKNTKYIRFISRSAY